MILHLLCTNIDGNTTKVVIKILQNRAVTKTVQGRLIIHYLVAIFFENFLYYVSAKSYENRLTHVKVISKSKVGPF